MKRSVAVVASVALATALGAGGVYAQPTHVHDAMSGMSGTTANKPGTSAVHRLSGTVKKADAAAKTVTIDHGPVQSLSWPAMTMTFKVDDPAVLARLKPGLKVDADMVQRDKDYVITAVR